MSNEHWRWNVNPAWESHATMCESAYYAKHAPHEFERYKHLKSVLIFGANALEAYLNELMRQHMKSKCTPEDFIYKRLRRTRIKDKLKDWPVEFGSAQLPVTANEAGILDVIEEFQEIRDNVTHPKSRDHSIYLRLDTIAPTSIVETISKAVAALAISASRPFPYWSLGWNFVGFNFDDAHPCLSGVSEFRHALARLRLMPPGSASIGSIADAWTTHNMSSIAAYERLKAMLDLLSFDIEPWFEYAPGIGSPPRLTRRWWDRAFIYSTVPGGHLRQ